MRSQIDLAQVHELIRRAGGESFRKERASISEIMTLLRAFGRIEATYATIHTYDAAEVAAKAWKWYNWHEEPAVTVGITGGVASPWTNDVPLTDNKNPWYSKGWIFHLLQFRSTAYDTALSKISHSNAVHLWTYDRTHALTPTNPFYVHRVTTENKSQATHTEWHVPAQGFTLLPGAVLEFTQVTLDFAATDRQQIVMQGYWEWHPELPWGEVCHR